MPARRAEIAERGGPAESRAVAPRGDGGECERALERMGAALEEVERRRELLAAFHVEMQQNQPHFAAEEVEACEATLREMEQRARLMRADLARRVDLYEEQARALSEGLATRQRLIDAYQAKGAFSDDDAIYSVLVQTHSRLTDQLARAQASLT